MKQLCAVLTGMQVKTARLFSAKKMCYFLRAFPSKMSGDVRRSSNIFSFHFSCTDLVVPGLQVSHNYEQGQQLLQSREFSSRPQSFF